MSTAPVTRSVLNGHTAVSAITESMVSHTVKSSIIAFETRRKIADDSFDTRMAKLETQVDDISSQVTLMTSQIKKKQSLPLSPPPTALSNDRSAKWTKWRLSLSKWRLLSKISLNKGAPTAVPLESPAPLAPLKNEKNPPTAHPPKGARRQTDRGKN
jgi:hypothetical protein